MMKVYLDPGHGGKDRGGSGFVDEATTNLAIAHSVRVLLQSVPGVEVRMSRYVDDSVSLDYRTTDAGSWGADCLISIHNNSMGGSGSAFGTETFVQKFDEHSACLGTLIQRNVHGVINRKDRGVLTRDYSTGAFHRYADDNVRGERNYYHMLREASMSAVIVEGAFMDNPADAELLKSPDVLARMAKAIADAVVEWGRNSGLLPADAPQPDPPSEYPKEVQAALDKLVHLGATNKPDVKELDLDRLAVILDRLGLLDRP